MMRRKSPEPLPKMQDDRSRGDGEPAVVRPDDEASWTKERWREQAAPHRPGKYLWMSDTYAQTMSELNDAGFLITMRNRLKAAEFERSGPGFWQRIKGVLFGAPRKTALAGFEIRRLKQIAGEVPPDSLSEHQVYNVSYELFLSMVVAAERIVAGDARSDKTSDPAD